MSDQAWLDKRQGRYVIRFNDWAKLRPNGKPRVGFHSLRDEAGQPVRSIAVANAGLAAFIARMPAPPRRTRNKGTVIVPDRRSIVQIAWAWHQAHPQNTTRDDYMRAAQWLTAEAQLGITYPQELTAAAVTQLKSQRNHRGVHKPLAYLRSILGWAAGEAALIDPLDPRLLSAMSQPQSRKPRYDLMTVAQWRATMEACRAAGGCHLALGHCISTYMWRPATACRVLVGDVDLDRRWIHLRHVKDTSKDKGHEPVEHYLHEETVNLLRPLMAGREATDPLFTKPDGSPWATLSPSEPGYGRGARDYVCNWFQHRIQPLLGPKQGGVNAWRRFALWRMDYGIAPWPEVMRDAQITAHSGHEDLTVLRRYRRTNDEQLRKLVGIDEHEPIVIDEESHHSEVVWSGVDLRQAPTDADESVSFPRLSRP